MNNKLIYIADDEQNIRNIIISFLVKEGFEVVGFSDGSTLFEAFNKKPADMLVIDIMMPNLDGYSLCSLIRKNSPVPIIFVSAKDTELDKIAGLNLGGDDYMTKPFSPMELIARIKSTFRRIDMDKPQQKVDHIVQIFDVILNTDTKETSVNGNNIALTGMEFSLLLYLSVNKNRAVSRQELLSTCGDLKMTLKQELPMI